MSVRARHDSSDSTEVSTGVGCGPLAATTAAPRRPRVLAVAGSDPSGGAGIQADLKAVAAAGGYGMAALTALTAQNTRGVRGVHVPPAEFLTAQLEAVADDVAIDAVKIGMLASAPVARAVGAWLDGLPRGATSSRPPVVLDPVMVATSGDRLLDAAAERAVRDLLPRVDVVTPNLPELAVLAEEPPAADWAAALRQARRLAARYDVLVLAKGGHLDGSRARAGADAGAPDALVGPDGVLVEVPGERVRTTATHGTGCSLSSGLAVRYVRTGDWAEALRGTKAWLTAAIRAGEALRVGAGHGPVDHLAGSTPSGAVAPEPAPAPAPEPDGGPAGRDVVARWWDHAAPVRAAVDDLPFVRALGDGSLAPGHFRTYLEQDAIYLREYARCLARVSQLAPTRAEQAFWAGGAHGALVTELDLHTRWLGGEPRDVPASATTAAYLEHLRAAGDDYATLVAAVLPCYWIYQDVGERLAALDRPGHPYSAWLGTYADEAFAAATRQAVAILRRVAGAAGPVVQERMAAAFHGSCRHELAFFDQTGQREQGDVPGQDAALPARRTTVSGVPIG
ncbi:bifunctional hydroxymethylpyrimidine kinase/phosphomethylpyrimidine kinase [Isoptericola sp. NPDC057191]|uniref:bifunctional hydroxymethylpyrimidine kinase/phosphomethylpyrimidine kinase n=1 Tax=Isoptericola sp. NPDC057191 TaxID=3346041 RepID=UPI0036277AAD